MLIKVIGDEIYFDNEKSRSSNTPRRTLTTSSCSKKFAIKNRSKKSTRAKKIKRLIEEIQDSVQDAYRAVSNAEDEINWLERKIDELEDEL